MYSNTFKPIGNLVKAAFLTGAFIFSESTNLWASSAPELSEAEKEIVQRVSNYENADFTQTAVKLLPQDQAKLIYFSLGLGCDMPILEALYHVLKPQPITLEEYQVYEGLITKDASLLNNLHEDLRTPMKLVIEKDWNYQLYFSNQNLKALPRMIGHYHHLTALILLGNQLTQLPQTIGQLSALQELNLNKNQLTQLPQTIGQLSALQRLDLWGNQLTQLPQTIGQLSALQRLNLSKNQLTQLPQAIGQLVALTELDLSINQFTQLPQAIGQLVALTELILSGNPILKSLYTRTAVQGYVEGADHIRAMFRSTTNITFTDAQELNDVEILGTRE